jgi:AcrR family transcriptional regulator
VGGLVATRLVSILGSRRSSSTKGFDATSVDQIARMAGVNKALIYYHFKNKGRSDPALFESIIEEVAAHVEHPRGCRRRRHVPRRGIQEEVEFSPGESAYFR